MILLKDYIGKIYKEITNAKVQSDIETLVIANEYANNPMLKHFSVPNIRIKNMELTIPVAVDATQTTTRDYTEREIKDVYMNAFESTFLSFLPTKRDYLESIQLDLSGKAQYVAADAAPQLQQASVEDRQVALAQSEPTVESLTKTTIDSQETIQRESYATAVGTSYEVASTRVAVNFVETSYGYVDGQIPRQEFELAITERIKAALVPKSPAIEELPVIVETQKLKLINDPMSMINIKVNITDDAMEWTTDVDDNGETRQVLNYE